jgi:hypothetical protein
VTSDLAAGTLFQLLMVLLLLLLLMQCHLVLQLSFAQQLQQEQPNKQSQA